MIKIGIQDQGVVGAIHDPPVLDLDLDQGIIHSKGVIEARAHTLNV